MSLHFDPDGYPLHTRARFTTPEDDVCASDCEACEYERLPVCVMGCDDGWIEDVNGTGVGMDCPLHKGQKTRTHFQQITTVQAPAAETGKGEL